MSTQLSKKLLATLSLACFLLSACKKETLLLEDQHAVGVSHRITVADKKQNRPVLFVSNRDGNDEIYAMDEDGTNVMRLTYNNVPDGRAAWSSNGEHIAYASGIAGSRDIYVMNFNSGISRNITNTPNADEEWPEWSPNGNIIFSSNRDENHELYLSNMGGNHVQRLTYRAQDDKWPTYSANGMWIAFQSDLGIGNGRTDVFIMRPDGSHLMRLTNSAFLDQMPSWSPNGSKLAFMTTRDGNPEIYVMDFGGLNQLRLTNTPAVDGRPSWSREDNTIVFTSARDFALPSANPKFEIYKMNGDGTGQTRLSNNSIYDDFPYIK